MANCYTLEELKAAICDGTATAADIQRSTNCMTAAQEAAIWNAFFDCAFPCEPLENSGLVTDIALFK